MSSLVLEETGRDLQFQGDVSLMIFPSLGMELGAMSFANAPTFGESPMVRIGAPPCTELAAAFTRLTGAPPAPDRCP